MTIRRHIVAVAVLGCLAGWEPFRSPHPDVARGNRAFAEGHWDDAIAAYERARGTDADRDAAIDYDVGTAKLRKAEQMPAGDERDRTEREAMEALERAGRAGRADIRARAGYNRGNALLGKDRLDEAIDAYKEALRADPDFADARLNLEHALARRQKQQRRDPSASQGGGQGQQGRPGSGTPGQQGQPGTQSQPDSQGQPGTQEKSDQPGSQGAPGSSGQPPGAPGSSQGQPGDDPARPPDAPDGSSGSPGAPPGDPGASDASPDAAPPDDPGSAGRPGRSRATPRSPRSPAERKLDDMERSSRDLRREQVRRRTQDTYRPPDGPDW